MLKLQSRCLQRSARAYAQHTHVAFRRGRTLLTLAIETSCDDTSVAVLETHSTSSEPQPNAISTRAHLHFHKKVTANNSAYNGIHPLVAIEGHQKNLAALVNESIQHLPPKSSDHSRFPAAKPDFVTVTRGPGLRSALFTGLDTAKGLTVAWQIPLLAVNHMQAHALTPRLVSALNAPAPASSTVHEGGTSEEWEPTPKFPFLTLLVSGGHTLLVHTRSATDHAILASTADIAIGDCIDKMAREILPPDLLRSADDVMYGRLLERFAFPNGASDHHKYDFVTPPPRRGPAPEQTTSPLQQQQQQQQQQRSWILPIPMHDKGRSRASHFSFSGLETVVRRLCESNRAMPLDARRTLARESMGVAFEHLALRTVWALQRLNPQSGASRPNSKSQSAKRRTLPDTPPETQDRIHTLVLSGGVASNGFLRAIMREWLLREGFGGVEVIAPPVELCTDNAAMIAWCGVEMWRAGWESGLEVQARRKWSVDPESEEGGILGVEGWRRRRGKV